MISPASGLIFFSVFHRESANPGNTPALSWQSRGMSRFVPAGSGSVSECRRILYPKRCLSGVNRGASEFLLDAEKLVVLRDTL